jgi:hypothetical protein
MKLSYEHLQFVKIFQGVIPLTPVKGEGMEIMKGRKEKGRGGVKGNGQGLRRKEREGYRPLRTKILRTGLPPRLLPVGRPTKCFA